MRLTRETLLKIARDTAAQRARVSRRIICIYLTGSVLTENPLLGGTTDIDLVIVHDSEPLQAREIVRLTDEVHLDISHFDQAVFQYPRQLRTHPWLGPYIYRKPLVLHDTQHWFDFTQAATGAQFFQVDNIIQRARTLAQDARQAWMHLEAGAQGQHPARVYAYLEALENAGNALVCLTGEGNPLPERRFLLQLPQRLQEIQRTDLVAGLTGLLAPDYNTLEPLWPAWIQSWKETFHAASVSEDAPARLHPTRQLYYERAAAALWEENPDAAVWLVLRIWTLAAGHLAGLASREGAAVSPAPNADWEAAVQLIGLSADRFPERLHALDLYLDQVEEALDTWSQDNGVTDIPQI
jgi:hypothetical protein